MKILILFKKKEKKRAYFLQLLTIYKYQNHVYDFKIEFTYLLTYVRLFAIEIGSRDTMFLF